MVQGIMSGLFIMSISPISASMMSMYVASTASSASAKEKDYEYELIKQQLMAMGLTVTGDKNTDKIRLETAQRIQEMMEAQSASNTKQSIPFEDIMNTLNLTVTGDLDEDYDNTIDKLDYEIGMAYTDEEKEYYEALKDQVESEYNSSKQNSISYFSGASQLSSLNRYMLGI